MEICSCNIISKSKVNTMEFTLEARKKDNSIFSVLELADSITGRHYSKNLIGEGQQAQVYEKCLTKDRCIAVKNLYLSPKESKLIANNKLVSTKALHYLFPIEYASKRLTNSLLFGGICPHFVLNIGTSFSNRKNKVCGKKFPLKAVFYDELVVDNQPLKLFKIKNSKVSSVLMFQILYALLSLKGHFSMIHLDLHSENILIKKVKPGGFWSYNIGSRSFLLPNLGFVVLIIDFGHGSIPKKLESWFATKLYKDNLAESPNSIDIKRIITTTPALKNYYEGESYELEMAFKIYASKFLVKNKVKGKKKLIDSYNLFSNPDYSEIPPNLQRYLGLNPST
jgi:hypothetical protein